jgi:hypothetical protein
MCEGPPISKIDTTRTKTGDVLYIVETPDNVERSRCMFKIGLFGMLCSERERVTAFMYENVQTDVWKP